MFTQEQIDKLTLLGFEATRNKGQYTTRDATVYVYDTPASIKTEADAARQTLGPSVSISFCSFKNESLTDLARKLTITVDIALNAKEIISET